MKAILIASPVLLAVGFFGGFLVAKNPPRDSKNQIMLKEGVSRIVAEDQRWAGMINNQKGNLIVEFQTSGAGFTFRSDESGDVNAVYLPPNGKPVALDRNGQLVEQ